jgi:hypothetical protein
MIRKVKSGYKVVSHKTGKNFGVYKTKKTALKRFQKTMRIPEESNRIAIVGATGSGKTQAALWQLSMRDIDTRPWIIFNWKNDSSIDNIPYAQNIELDEVPIKPGVYIAHPRPDEDTEPLLWQIWERGGIGVYVDEGYMVGDRNAPFRAILTQGRSKQIPVIVLSESEFFQIFRLQHNKDRKSVQEFVSKPIDKRLPEFHSYYYDVSRDSVTVLKPVPSIDTIYATFERKLARVRKTV